MPSRVDLQHPRDAVAWLASALIAARSCTSGPSCSPAVVIIFTKNASARAYQGPVSFDFLGYTFRPRGTVETPGRFSCRRETARTFSPEMSRQGDIRTTDRAFDAWMDREFPGLSAPCGSADLKDVESDDDAAFNGVRALVGIDGAVGLLRGEPSGDDVT